MFNMFYDTSVGVYDDLWDGKYSSEKSMVYLGNIMADIQPFRVGTIDSLDKEKYGLVPDSTKKLFCKENDLLVQGRLLDIGGVKYRTAYVEKRHFGMMALVREI